MYTIGKAPLSFVHFCTIYIYIFPCDTLSPWTRATLPCYMYIHPPRRKQGFTGRRTSRLSRAPCRQVLNQIKITMNANRSALSNQMMCLIDFGKIVNCAIGRGWSGTIYSVFRARQHRSYAMCNLCAALWQFAQRFYDTNITDLWLWWCGGMWWRLSARTLCIYTASRKVFADPMR